MAPRKLRRREAAVLQKERGVFPDFDTKRYPFASLQPRSARRCKSQPGYSREKS
jgi:hypothetical protein